MRKTALGLMLALVVGACVGSALRSAPQPESRASVRPLAVQDSFADVAERVTRSVVHITTRTGPVGDWPFLVPEGQGVGSGIVVGADGHVLTNLHVVRGARSVKVRFVDGKQVDAKVAGADPETDLALLKIEAAGKVELHPIPFADSEKCRIGDWVLAIGSPFGYSHTVTVGIVSAKHRRAGLNLAYQDFLQTDAAINPGNSGGALVDLDGNLVGINTAILSQTRSHDGVGFAIPSSLARWVCENLAAHGEVRRGFLGVEMSDIDESLVELYRSTDIETLDDLLDELGLEEPTGAFIRTVVPDTPAAAAGLRRGDVILGYDGRKIRNIVDLSLAVAKKGPGHKGKLVLLRDGREETVEIELGERPK